MIQLLDVAVIYNLPLSSSFTLLSLPHSSSKQLCPSVVISVASYLFCGSFIKFCIMIDGSVKYNHYNVHGNISTLLMMHVLLKDLTGSIILI